MQTSSAQGVAGRPRFTLLYRSLGVNVVLPLIVAQVLLHQGRSTIVSLAVAAIFPLAAGIVSALRRRIDLLGVMSLLAILLGIALAILSGNPVFAIAKESIFTAAFGLTFLGSLAMPRPLIFHFGRQFNGGDDPAVAAAWDANWANPGFRRVLRLMTAVWGIGLLAEAALRVGVALTVQPALAIVLSPIIGIGSIALLILWTTAYAARARRRAAAAAATA